MRGLIHFAPPLHQWLPAGSIAEVVAKAARDRSARCAAECLLKVLRCFCKTVYTNSACRCKVNQENTPDLMGSPAKATPNSGAPFRRNSSIARSPLSSINSPMYPASAIADPDSGYICMRTNFTFNCRRSVTPCLEPALCDPLDVAPGHKAQLDTVSYDDCPKTPDSCHTVAKQVRTFIRGC